MMAAVFSMQPIGQIAGNLVSLVVVAAYRSQGEDNLVRTVDTMWRWVIGLGVIPGVLAVAFRFAIPETPRFMLDIEDDPIKAEFDATPLFGDITGEGSMSAGSTMEMEEGAGSSLSPTSVEGVTAYEEIVLPAPAMHDGRPSEATESSTAPWTISANTQQITLNSPWKLSRKDIKQYFWTEGNWRTLFATSMTWVSYRSCGSP
jgi:MFS transporter, PHS family, inorganic phosphate transporter